MAIDDLQQLLGHDQLYASGLRRVAMI